MADAFLSRRQVLRALTGGGLAAGLLAGAAARAADDDDEIDLAKVPAKVKEAASKAVPHAKWESASKSVEDGETTYTLEGTDAKGRSVSVDVEEDGTVDEVQTEVPMNQVPRLVQRALKAKQPRFKATTVYEVREEGKVTRYDFEGKRPADKDDITVTVSSDGKEVEVEAD